jgi:formamidopyrimidine-DNA glycosylase
VERVPELPEVEVSRRRLAPLLIGRRLAEVRTSRPSRFFVTPPRRLRARLPGRLVLDLVRRGKYLLVGLDDGSSLLLHHGMTGQLLTAGCSNPRLLRAAERAAPPYGGFRPDEHTHLQLGFEDGGPGLLFRDIRRFGRVMLVEPGEEVPRLLRLGPDALEASGDRLWESSRGRRRAVKSMLLDQAVLAGVGNIYADEALFRAGVRPTRRAGRLRRRECDALATALREVLLRGIETGGSSVDDFVAPDGSDGCYQNEHLVYQRDGQPCRRCGRELERVVVGGRSSHYCPSCQR